MNSLSRAKLITAWAVFGFYPIFVTVFFSFWRSFYFLSCFFWRYFMRIWFSSAREAIVVGGAASAPMFGTCCGVVSNWFGSSCISNYLRLPEETMAL